MIPLKMVSLEWDVKCHQPRMPEHDAPPPETGQIETKSKNTMFHNAIPRVIDPSLT